MDPTPSEIANPNDDGPKKGTTGSPAYFSFHLGCARLWGVRCLSAQGVLLGGAAACFGSWEYTSATAPNSTARLSDADIGVAKSRCLDVVKTLAQTGVATPSWMLFLAPACVLFQRSSAVTAQEAHEALSVDFMMAGYNAYDVALPDSRHALGCTNDEAPRTCCTACKDAGPHLRTRAHTPHSTHTILTAVGPPLRRFTDRHFYGFPRVSALPIRTIGGSGREISVDTTFFNIIWY